MLLPSSSGQRGGRRRGGGRCSRPDVKTRVGNFMGCGASASSPSPLLLPLGLCKRYACLARRTSSRQAKLCAWNWCHILLLRAQRKTYRGSAAPGLCPWVLCEDLRGPRTDSFPLHSVLCPCGIRRPPQGAPSSPRWASLWARRAGAPASRAHSL